MLLPEEDIKRWKEFYEIMKKHQEDAMFDFFINGPKIKTEEEKLCDKLKYAKVYLDGQDHTTVVFMDNETMEAYVMINDSYYDGIKKPLEKETRSYIFERWCRGMDL